MVPLDKQLAALATMSPAQLRAEWMRIYKAPAPSMTTDLIRRGIANRMQERAYGGLAPGTIREIHRLCREHIKTGGMTAVGPAIIKPGTRLVRDWGGKSHHVLVLDDGYLYSDRRYRSLTQIASHITGVRWSGPRFFGLKQRAQAAHA